MAKSEPLIQMAAVFIGDIKIPLITIKFLASQLLFHISDKAFLAIEQSRESRLALQGTNVLTQ